MAYLVEHWTKGFMVFGYTLAGALYLQLQNYSNVNDC